MPAKTTNYGLTKPTAEEYYNVEIQNGNMDVIDGQLKANASDIYTLNSSLTAEITNRQTAVNTKEDLIKNASIKTSLIDADSLPFSDSSASNITKKITFANFRNLLASLFLPLTGGTISGKLQVNNNSGRQVAICQWADVSQCGGGLAMFANNAYLDHSDNTYKYSSAHLTLGARGIVFAPGITSPLWFDTGAATTTPNTAFTPTLYKLYGHHNVTKGASAPSGGSDGDIYLQYT